VFSSESFMSIAVLVTTQSLQQSAAEKYVEQMFLGCHIRNN